MATTPDVYSWTLRDAHRSGIEMDVVFEMIPYIAAQMARLTEK